LAKAKLGGVIVKGCVALAILAVVAKVYAALIVLLAIVLLYCMVTRPVPTLGFMLLGLLGALLQKVPDPIIAGAFVFVFFCWGISLLKRRPTTGAPQDESTLLAEEGGEAPKIASGANQSGT